MQPDFGEGPLAMDRGDGNSERFTDLRDGQAAKETQLNDLALAWIEPLQFTEGFVHAGQIDLARFVKFSGELQPILAAALFAAARDRVIRQGLAHRARENSQEMRAIFPQGIRLIFQTQESLMDESRPLERVPQSLAPEIDFRQAKQLVVISPDHLVERPGNSRRRRWS